MTLAELRTKMATMHMPECTGPCFTNGCTACAIIAAFELRDRDIAALNGDKQRLVEANASFLRAERGHASVAGVGPDAPTVTNAAGAKQSELRYRCDLLPAKATLAVAAVLHHGEVKYGKDNWRGIPQSDHINHAMTHYLAWLAGDKSDDHLGHAACRALMAIEAPSHHPGR